MPSVGTAYVNIRVNTKSFNTSLDQVMARLSAKMEKAGGDLGKDFERGLKKTNFDSAFNGLTNASDKATATTADHVNRITTEARIAKDSLGDLSGELRDAASSARRLKLGNLGGGGGGGLRNAANDAGFFSRKLNELVDEAPRGVAVLNGLFNAAAFGGTALAGLVGGLSAAAQGIFAVGANAAAAAPALSIMANGLMSLGQVGGVVALAMNGVGKAIGLGFKAATASAAKVGRANAGIGKATAAAARAVRDAKQALQDAYRAAARAAEEAARRTRKAEQDLAAAQRETLIAQKALNAARKEGLEQLEDIAFAAEDAALAEQRAGLDLQDAFNQLQAVSELAPDNRARIEAELAFKEAELHLREAKDAREDADKAQKQAAKSGVEGTDAVISAKDDLASAQQNEADASEALADARRNEAQVAEDNARRIRDALQNVADAEDRLREARKGGTRATTAAAKATDLFAQAMAKLGPEQRKFVNTILGMKDEFQAFRNAVAEPLFERLNIALANFINSGIGGVVQKGLIGTAKALGDTAIQASHLAESPVFQRSLADSMRQNNVAIRNFGSSGVHLADAFVQITDAAGPLFIRFSRWVNSVTRGWAETLRLKNRTGELTKTFNTAGDRAAEWGQMFKQLWRTLMILGHAANDAANGFEGMSNKGKKTKGYIPSLTQSLKEFNDKLEKNPTLVDKFTQALNNLNAVGRAIKTVFQPFLDMGSNPQIAEAFNTISQSDAFKRLGDQATNAVPELADLVVAIADIVADLSESGAIDHFLAFLTQAARVGADFSHALNNTGILKFTGYITGGIAALRLLWKVVKIGTSPFVSLSKGFTTFMGNVRKARAGGKGLAGSIFGSIGKGATSAGGAAAGSADNVPIITAIESAAASIVTAIDACCVRLTAAMGRGAAAGAVGETLSAAPARGAGPAVGAIGGLGNVGAETAKIGRFSGFMAKFAKVLGPVTKLMKPLSFGIRALGAAFRFALGPVGLIVLTLLPLLWPLLVKLEEKTGIFSKALDVLKAGLSKAGDGFKWLWDKTKEVFNWIKDNWPLLLAILTGPIGLAVLAITKNWDKIVSTVKAIPGRIRKILSHVWDVFTKGLKVHWDKVQKIWGTINKWIQGRPAQFKKNLTALWEIFTKGLKTHWDKVQKIWGTINKWIQGRPAQFRRNLSALWSILTSALSKAWDNVQRKWNNIRDSIGKWPKQVGDRLRNIFSSLKSGFKSAYNDVARMVNKNLIGGINNILGVLHVKEIGFRMPTFAKGGPVRGPGGPTSDRIIAALSNGEYVMPEKASRKLGPKTLDYMRKTGEIPPELGIGGLFGDIGHKFSQLAGAVKDGAATALKWILNKVTDVMPGGLLGNMLTGILRQVSSGVISFGKKRDKEAAAKAAAAAGAGGTYHGPPGGWTYPLAKHVVITQYPNRGHNPSWSVDLGAPMGTGVRAASRGVVNTVRDLGGSSYGRYIVISHAGGMETLYAHLRSFKVRAGQKVKTGQLIAYSDSTGHSTGPHLHFELKPSSNTVNAMAARGVRLATGGVVAPSPSGTLALLAEAGKHERVTPLDPEGFTPAERRIIETLEAKMGGGGGDQYHIHPSEKMDETRLADLVARRMAWKRRRGAGR